MDNPWEIRFWSLDLNHFEMCRFNDPHDSSYKRIIQSMEELSKSINDTSSSKKFTIYVWFLLSQLLWRSSVIDTTGHINSSAPSYTHKSASRSTQRNFYEPAHSSLRRSHFAGSAYPYGQAAHQAAHSEFTSDQQKSTAHYEPNKLTGSAFHVTSPSHLHEDDFPVRVINESPPFNEQSFQGWGTLPSLLRCSVS